MTSVSLLGMSAGASSLMRSGGAFRAPKMDILEVLGRMCFKEVRGWNHTGWGQDIAVDRSVDDARADDYDALLLPGGVMNPDHLRMSPKAVQFVKQVFDDGKPSR